MSPGCIHNKLIQLHNINAIYAASLALQRMQEIRIIIYWQHKIFSNQYF